MKKNLIRVLTSLLALILVLSIGAVAFAVPTAVENPDPVPTPIDGSTYEPFIRSNAPRGQGNHSSGVLPSTLTQAERDARNAAAMPKREERRLAVAAKKAAAAAAAGVSPNTLQAQDGPNAVAVTWYDLSPFTYYPQQTNYTCVPACVRMALKQIKGTTPSENVVKVGCNTTSSGTDLDDACDYLNDSQNYFDYIIKGGGTSRTSMKNHLLETITEFEAPPIVIVEEYKPEGWCGNLDDHAIAIYAINSTKSEVWLCDPWAGHIGMTDMRWYPMNMELLHEAMQSSGVGYIY